MLCDFEEVGLLRTDVEVEGPDTALTLTGELDRCSRYPFWEELSRAAAATTGLVILDLSRLAFLDAAGLRALEKAHLMMGERLIVRRPSLAVRRLLELSGLDHGLTIQVVDHVTGHQRRADRSGQPLAVEDQGLGYAA